MDNKSQYFFIAVMLFLKQPFIFGDDCKCEGLVNVFQSTMSKEIFDLKMENTMLQARMDKMQSMLQEKSSSTSSRGLDTARLEGFENRLSSIESNRQHTIKVPTNTLKLHSLIAKALRSEKEKRIQAESNTRKHMQFFNQSISDLKIKVDFVLNSNLTYIVNDIEKVEQKMYDGLDQVKNDIRNLQSNISELQSQSNALSDKDISELGLDLAAMNKSVATDIAEIEQRMSDGFLNVKNKIKTMQTKVKKQYKVNVLIGKNVTELETGLSKIDQDVITMKADIKTLQELSLISLKVPRCEQILDFYGGDVTYLGDRKVYSQAVYRCDDTFSLFPSNVEHSECDDTLRWIPDAPNCFKKAKKEIPANGYSRQEGNDILLHSESYRVCCYRSYEMKSGANYIDRNCERIVNNNGTLEPSVPECVEERCDPSEQYQANVKYENGTVVQEKFPSQTDVFLSCKRGYDYYRGDRPMQTPLKRTCIKGNIKNAPRCQEAWCLISGYPNNEDTFHRVYRADARLIAEDQYIYPRETIEVFCKKGYELYINSSKSYRRLEFTSECRYGLFSETNEKFPICLEKRCDPDDLSNAVVKDKIGERIRTKIPSRTEVYLSCQNGYEYYSNGRPMNKPVIRECVKGIIMNAPECEKSCKLPDVLRYSYEDSDGMERKPGSIISDGTTLTVTCTTLDLYEFNTDYDYGYDTESTSGPTITCADNTLSQFELDCPEVAADTCMELEHGNVKKENGYYMVSCDKGYSLNLITPEKTQCICYSGTLKSVYGNQVPRCKPDHPKKCVYTPDEGHKWHPKWKDIDRLGSGYSWSSTDKVSESSCKETCINKTHMDCKSIYFNDEHEECWLFAVSDPSYFIQKSDSWPSRLYILSCE